MRALILPTTYGKTNTDPIRRLFLFLYIIYIQASKSVEIHKYKQIKRTEPVHQAQKKKKSPSHVKSSLFFFPMK